MDCIEYFSEKLISVIISQQLRYQIHNIARRLHEVGIINAGEVKSFGFRNCTSIDQLMDALRAFPEWSGQFIRKKCRNWGDLYRASVKRAKEELDQDHMDREYDEIYNDGGFSLGPLDPTRFFFYLVLDNVKSLFKIER